MSQFATAIMFSRHRISKRPGERVDTGDLRPRWSYAIAAIRRTPLPAKRPFLPRFANELVGPELGAQASNDKDVVHSF